MENSTTPSGRRVCSGMTRSITNHHTSSSCRNHPWKETSLCLKIGSTTKRFAISPYELSFVAVVHISFVHSLVFVLPRICCHQFMSSI
ncbi:unnamed protein product [Haemonchus placei]|uniref:Ovule protein n=1 Tax=Haemonchus placei TaxID=6290 RepID=A0A0N4X6Y5_HAEPC|nr:unnamed protein product [Haemonchus placei]